jgi:primosomal protein N''
MSSKLDKKIEKHSEKIIEKLADLKELAFDKSDEIKIQIIDYVDSLIAQVEAFEEDLTTPGYDEWEKETRKRLADPEKWKNVPIEDIPLIELAPKRKQT